MNNQILIIGALIFSLIAFLGLLIWRAVNERVYKNSADWKKVRTKARAASALALWLVFFGWSVIAYFLNPNAAFTLSNLRTMVEILFGFQCGIELIAGIYYKKIVFCNKN